MRSFGRGALALLLAFLVIAGAAVAERIGPAAPAAAVQGSAVSGVWLCPHGGGDGWQGTIVLADPGPVPVDVRLTELGDGPSEPPVTLTIPGGHEVLQQVRADSPADATYVEVFGGWAAAGWVLRGAGDTDGLAAEPCAPAGGNSWAVVDANTNQREHADLVVMNPFSVDAVFDVALFRPRLPPVRSADWTDVTLSPGRSMSLNVGSKLLGQPVVGVELEVSRGRVAASSLGWSTDGGIRSVLASPVGPAGWYLPVAQGADESTLQILVTGSDGVQLTTQLLSSEAEPTGAGPAADTQQPGASTAGYEIISNGPASVDVVSAGGVPIVAALRAAGRGGDAAATGGTASPGPAWVVTPTTAARKPRPGLVVVNPGTAPVEVTFRLLTQGSGAPGPEATITVPAGRVMSAPTNLLQQAPAASVLVTADGDIVALGVSTSGGNHGLDLYASAIGIPIPPDEGL